MALVVKAEVEADVLDVVSFAQSAACLDQAKLHMVLTGRHPQGCLEGADQMEFAYVSNFCEIVKRDWSIEVASHIVQYVAKPLLVERVRSAVACR